jgi:flagellar M-ring protein FliF
MKTLQEQFEEFKKFLQSSSWSVRVLSTLLAALVIIGLAFLFRTQTAGEGDYLFGAREFSVDELFAMEAAFAKAGLGESEIVGTRIRVPSHQKAEYVAALAEENALPINFGDRQDEASTSAGLFESKDSLDYKRKIARQRELSLVVSKMPDVRAATVQIDERSIGFPPKIEKRAMVAVQTLGNRALDPQRIGAIRRLISGAVTGLDVADVTVSDINTGVSWNGTSAEGSPDGLDSPYLAHKARYERDWKEKIENQLSMIPGVVVGVNVALDPQMSSSQSSMKIDPKTVALRSSESNEERTSATLDDGGRPGAVPNGVVSNQGARVEPTTTKRDDQMTKSASEQEAVASKDFTQIVKAGLIPERVTSSVLVPESYYVAIWRKSQPAPAAGTPAATPAAPPEADLKVIRDDLKKRIEEIVVNLLPPLPPGVDPYPRVSVTSYQDLPGEPLPVPGYSDYAMDWALANWQKLGLGVLALIALVMLNRFVKQRPTDGSANPAAAAEGAHEALAAGSPEAVAAKEAEEAARRRRFAEAGPDLKEELAGLVRDDEDAAVNVLKSWISEAA